MKPSANHSRNNQGTSGFTLKGKDKRVALTYTYKCVNTISNTSKLRLSTGLREVTPDHDAPGCKVSQQISWELLLNTAENQKEN